MSTELIQAVLKLATPSLNDLSEETGIAYSTLRAWSSGHRSPSPDNVQIIASALRTRADQLRVMADQLCGCDPVSSPARVSAQGLDDT